MSQPTQLGGSESAYELVPVNDHDGTPPAGITGFPLRLPGPNPPRHPILARNVDILLSLVPLAVIAFASLALAYDRMPVTQDSRARTILLVSSSVSAPTFDHAEAYLLKGYALR